MAVKMEDCNTLMLIFFMFMLAGQVLSTNFPAQQSSTNQTTSFILVDNRQPQYCNSPGWDKNPADIKVLSGSFFYYQCKNRLAYNKTLWFVDGRTNILHTQYANRVEIQNNGKTLKFGPVLKTDDNLGINCEVYTSYGYLPSPLGIIRVIRPPQYSPSTGSALISKPYYFDFKYSGSLPDTYKWYKNGFLFQGEEGRVIVDSHGITFTRVLQKDSGLYYVKSHNKAGSASGSGYLRVLYWWRNGSHYQNAASSNPDVPLNVAVAIAVDTKNRKIPNYNKPETTPLSVSAVDSTAHAFRLMRRLHNKATVHARAQGQSRDEIETMLRHIMSIVGHPLTNFNNEEEKKLLEAAHCQLSTMEFNCKHETVLQYRTINGTCNNMLFPLNGASHSPFSRLLPAVYEDGISQPLGYGQSLSHNVFNGPWPSARYVSWKLIKDLERDGPQSMSHMFMSWGQFIDHDLDLAPIFAEEEVECGCNFTSLCLPILVKSDDPVFGDNTPHMGECIPFTRSIPTCSTNGKTFVARNQINQLTSFIDASNIYGSDNKLAERLRLGVGGLLKEGGRTKSGKGNLPFQDEKPPNGYIPFFETGDERVNEQVALTVMHTIWLREHNRIARKLGEINKCWDDEKIYQETRKIVGAMLQDITFTEFLPMLFGEYYEQYVPNYTKYNPFVDATIPNSFSAGAFRFGHSLVRPVLMRLNEDYLPVEEGPLPLELAFFNPIQYFKSNGTDPILRGLLVAQAKEVDEFLNSILTSKLFTEGSKKLGVDLASLNIQRGRDHGLPPYRKWQRFCEEVFPGNNATFKYPSTEYVMKEIYGNKGFTEGMDLWVGGLAEKRLPGAQVGPTFACIIGLTFSRVRDGDRFWYQNSHVFHYYKLRELEKTSLSRVICNNADNIKRIQRNAFRSDQPRVSCDQLEDVNLDMWKDYRCHLNHRSSRDTVPQQGYYNDIMED